MIIKRAHLLDYDIDSLRLGAFYYCRQHYNYQKNIFQMNRGNLFLMKYMISSTPEIQISFNLEQLTGGAYHLFPSWS